MSFCFASCFLVVVVFLFFLLCYFVVFLIFGNLSKTTLKKMEIGKTAKMKNAQKTDILTKAVSTVVFTNSVFVSFCVSFNFAFFAENTIKIGVSAKKKNKKNNKILKVKKVGQVKVKKWSNYVAQHNWTTF